MNIYTRSTCVYYLLVESFACNFLLLLFDLSNSSKSSTQNPIICHIIYLVLIGIIIFFIYFFLYTKKIHRSTVYIHHISILLLHIHFLCHIKVTHNTRTLRKKSFRFREKVSNEMYTYQKEPRMKEIDKFLTNKI